jgi:hypothetical protein
MKKQVITVKKIVNSLTNTVIQVIIKLNQSKYYAENCEKIYQ